jgi:hypothetical protein
MVDIIYDSYDYRPKIKFEYRIPDDGTTQQFGPKSFDMKDYEYRHRFDYNLSKETINC